uniref:Uncharacterized protein n=1 Tax=Timema poppense TaxID=170557 RepID=A0A7R9CQQ2_TIMPO|nr:unnamed protein product [Timema poppensis]
MDSLSVQQYRPPRNAVPNEDQLWPDASIIYTINPGIVKEKYLSSCQDLISRLKASYVQVVVGLMLDLIVPSKMRNIITVILEDTLLRVKNSSQHQGGVRKIQEDIPSVSVQATTACDLYVVNSNQAPALSSVQLEVNGVPLTMEVDTAASTSLIGKPVYLAHFKHLPLISLVSLGPLTAVQVATETRKDPILSRVLTYVLNGWPDVVPDEGLRPFHR